MRESVVVFRVHLEREAAKFRSDPYEWFVLTGNRLTIAFLLTAAFAVVVLSLMGTRIITVERTPEIIYLAQGLMAGNLTLVTIVLAINQLVLSREFRAPGELREHIRDVISYRNDVEKTTNRNVVPVSPSDFLIVLLDGTRENAQRLGGVVRGLETNSLVREVDAFVTEITTNIDPVRDELAFSEEGIFTALVATLETNYSHQLNEAHRLQTLYKDDLSPSEHEVLAEVIESLQQVDIARQYFKSLYIQSELASLSRILLYVGVPAVGSAIILFLIYAGGPSPAVAMTYLSAFVLLVVVLGFSLLAILFSFVIRIAVVAQQTVAITPFTNPE